MGQQEGIAFNYSFDVIGWAENDLPPVGCSVIDFEGGGGLQSQMTDCAPDEVR